jgi:hypothetical protein
LFDDRWGNTIICLSQQGQRLFKPEGAALMRLNEQAKNTDRPKTSASGNVSGREVIYNHQVRL